MMLVYFFPNQTSPSKIKVIVLQSFVNASSDLLIMKLFFILACFGIIQALRFRDVFEVEYLLNIGKKTVIHIPCLHSFTTFGRSKNFGRNVIQITSLDSHLKAL